MKNTKIAIVALGVLAAVLGWTGSSAAFPNIQYWHMPSSGRAGMNRAGAGGLYGTGGQTDRGIRCSHCHIDGEGRIDFTMNVTPAFGTVGGEDAYTPGQRYTITIDMTGEHRFNPAGTGQSYNAMAATIEDASGGVAGRFISDSGQDSASCPSAEPFTATNQPAGATTVLFGDCHAVLPLGHADMTSWTFEWVAPAAGAGDLTMFLAIVDGDTRGESSLHDDTVERTIPLREGS